MCWRHIEEFEQNKADSFPFGINDFDHSSLLFPGIGDFKN